MTMVQLKNMKGSLIIRTLLGLALSIWSGYLSADLFPTGVAIEPMIIKVKNSGKSDIQVYNETDQDYIIVQKIVSNIENNKSPFVISPPIQLLKKRDDIKLNLIYLPENSTRNFREKFYLSVSFIPKTQNAHNNLFVPIVLVQQIPIELTNP
ncbi:TPA: fimbria/pilus periplasmic chaperone [Klebsiella oxytoca]